MIAFSVISVISLALLSHQGSSVCICGPNGETCDELTSSWVRLIKGRYWAWASAGGCDWKHPLPYLGWRYATDDEWRESYPANKRWWCVVDDDGWNPVFAVNNGENCYPDNWQSSGAQNFCGIPIFNNGIQYCHPRAPLNRGGSCSIHDILLIQECDDIEERLDGCSDFYWADETNNVIPLGCRFVKGVTDKTCLDKSVSMKCPYSCGVCETAENREARLANDPDADTDALWCAETETFTTTELTGVTTGGTPIIVSSPCITNTESMKVWCLFDGVTLVEAVPEDYSSFRCLVPRKRLAASPFTQHFGVRLGRIWFHDSREFTYVLPSDSDAPIMVSGGQIYELEWDPNDYGASDERLLIVQRRFFSGGMQGNEGMRILYETENTGYAVFEIPDSVDQDSGFLEDFQTTFAVMTWPCQSWIDTYGFPDAFVNVVDVGGAKRDFYGDGEETWQSNHKMAWADHPDIGGTNLADTLEDLLVESRTQLDSHVEAGAHTEGDEGSGQAGMYCYLGCLVGTDHTGEIAHAMMVEFLKFQPCGLRGTIEKNIDKGIHVCINGDYTRKQVGNNYCDPDYPAEGRSYCDTKCFQDFLEGGTLCHLDTIENGGSWTNVRDNVKERCKEDSVELINLGFVVVPDQCRIQIEGPLKGCGADPTESDPSCYDPENQASDCPLNEPNGAGAAMQGDPHFRTFDFDGITHQCQGNGVFWAITSQMGGIDPADLGFSGQVLIKKPSLSAMFSYVKGHSWKKDGYPAISIEYNDGWITHYGDESYDITDRADLDRLNSDADYFQVSFDGEKSTILTNWGAESHLTSGTAYTIRPPLSLFGKKMVGLMGTYDGDDSNDIVDFDGSNPRAFLSANPFFESSNDWCAQYKVPCGQSHFMQYSRRNLDNPLFDYCVDDPEPGRRRLRGRMRRESHSKKIRRLQNDGHVDGFDWESAQFTDTCRQRASDLCGGEYPGILDGICWQDMLLTDCMDENIPNQLISENGLINLILNGDKPAFDCGNVCKNGGTCVQSDDPDAYPGQGKCECPEGIEGHYCEEGVFVDFGDTSQPSRSPIVFYDPPTLITTDDPTNAPIIPSDSPTLGPIPSPTIMPSMAPTGSPICPEPCSVDQCNFVRLNAAGNVTRAPTLSPITCSAMIGNQDVLVDPLGCSQDDCRAVNCNDCGTQRDCVARCKIWRQSQGLEDCWYFRGLWCSQECKKKKRRFKCWFDCDRQISCPRRN